MSTAPKKCWICGEIADSGEHKIKASELRSLFGGSAGQALYFHSEKCRNLKVQSIKSDRLKFAKVICRYCNSARTQKHDRAWDKFSEFMRSQKLTVGERIRFNRIFSYNTTHYMRYVHLYFAKIFGCAIAEHNVPIDISGFSEAIKNDRLHPNLYIAFGEKPKDFTMKMAEISDLHVFMDDKEVAFAIWFLFLEHITVGVMYARDGERADGLCHAWHPHKNRQSVRMFDVNIT